MPQPTNCCVSDCSAKALYRVGRYGFCGKHRAEAVEHRKRCIKTFIIPKLAAREANFQARNKGRSKPKPGSGMTTQSLFSGKRW